MQYYIKQIGDKDCGITSLKILLANIYKNKDFLFYPQNYRNKSLSLNEIITIAKNEGVKLEAYRLIKKEELRFLKKKKILVILKHKNVLHISYVIKIMKNKIKIFDTSKGKIIYKMEEFLIYGQEKFLKLLK